jgi:hypothetical protein
MSVQMAKAKIKTESVNDVQAAGKTMFAALEAAQPAGVRYAWCRLPDGETFVALVQTDEGVENPLPGLREFQELQQVVGGALAEPPAVQSWTVVGSYRLF